MKCPKCSHEQQDGLLECQRCQIVFSRWKEAGNNEDVSSYRTPIPPQAQKEPPKPIPSTVIFSIITLIVIAIIGWMLFFPKGLPIQEGSYKNEKYNFAIKIPSDWLTITPENYKEIMDQYKDRFPKNIQNLLSQNSNIAVYFVKIAKNSSFSPSVNIITAKGNMPSLNESEKEKAAKEISAGMAGAFDAYEQESADIVKVDKLKSLQIISKASMKFLSSPSEPIMEESFPGFSHVVGHTQEQWETLKLKYIQVAVPGNNAAYILTFSTSVRDFSEYEFTFQDMVNSFRVLKRPTPFGPILGGAIKGGFIGMAGYIIYYLITVLLGLNEVKS